MHFQTLLVLVGAVAALPQGAFVKPMLEVRGTPIPPHPTTHKTTTSHSSTHKTSTTAAIVARAYDERLEEAYGGFERAAASPVPHPPPHPPTHPAPPPKPPVTTHAPVSTHIVTKTVTATSHSSTAVAALENFGFVRERRAILSPVPPPPPHTTHVITKTVTATHTSTHSTSTKHSTTVLKPQNFGFIRERRGIMTPVPPPPKTTTHVSSSHSSTSHPTSSHSSSSHSSVLVVTKTTTVIAERNVAATPTASGGAAPINTGALSLIEGLEGFKPNFYTIDGDETIGYGHDCTQLKDCSSIHPPISQAQGVALLKSDLVTYEKCVCALPNASGLNANQYGALVSFTYNSGCGGVQEYFTSQMSSKNYAGICSSLPTTNTKGGELSSRRQKEGAFCSQATTAMSGC